MPPVPNTLEFAKGQGMALTQAFGHLESEQQESHCEYALPFHP